MTALTQRLTSPFRAGRPLGLLLAALLPVLTACGSKEDKAASAAARSLEALGVHGMSWAKARIEGRDIVITDARADLDGAGPVHASELTVKGYADTDGGWQAESVSADFVDGAVRARKLSVLSPRGRREAGAWVVRDEGRTLEAYEGPLAGIPVTVRSANVGPPPRVPGRPEATQMAASGLRLSDRAPGGLSSLAGLDWDVSVRSELGRPGSAHIEVQRAEAKGWSVHGRIELAGGPDLASKLASLDPAALLDAGRWPEGVLLREADLDMTLSRPGTFLGTSAADPVAGSMAAKVAAGGLVSWHVRMQPRQPVPVRSLPGILSVAGADATLGLVAQVRDVVTPSRNAQQPPEAFALPSPAAPQGR